jgi:hypothetical protein
MWGLSFERHRRPPRRSQIGNRPRWRSRRCCSTERCGFSTATRTEETSFSANGSSIATLDPTRGIGTARINSARLEDGQLAVVSGGVLHVLREGAIVDTAKYWLGVSVHAFIVHP